MSLDDKYVIKKDGSKELFNLIEIKEMLKFACKNLDVNQIVLESNIHLSIKNNITTKEIQELLILETIKLISEQEPDWIYVAGRLATKLLINEVFKNTKIEYDDYPKYLNTAIKNKWYRGDIVEYYSQKDIYNISKLIKPQNDFKFSISQVLSLKDKYLIKSEKGFIEYPQFSDLTSALLLAIVEKNEDRIKWAKEFFYLIQEELNSIATPFKSNLRLLKGNVGSCFILANGDSLSQIVKSWIDMARISKEGGGIGWYAGYIRPGDTYSPKVVKANKINRWTKIVNDIALAVNQRGIRPGAITPALDWWHLDIETFIEMKSETNGDLRDKCFDLYPQVVIDNYFIDKVLANEDVYLFNQYELKEKHNIDIIPLLDQELYDTHLKIEQLILDGKLKGYYKISAKYLWKEFLRIWFETGDFYITNKNGLNISNYLKSVGIANCANLCVESFSLTLPPENWQSIGNKDGFETINSDGLYHSCNLSSINMANIHNDELLERVVKGSIRMLDNSIDVGNMPVYEAKQSSFLQRNIGLGTVGVADWMAYNKLSYEKSEDIDKLEALYEKIAYFSYRTSIELSKEKGSYPLFEKANYDKLFGRTGEQLNLDSIKNGNNFDWIQVIKDIKQDGIRNSLLLAIAPNTSSALVQNVIASYLPPHTKFNVQTLAKVIVPVIPKYLKTRNWYYKSKFYYNPIVIINITKRIQRWVDTGISMEVPINTEISNIKEISDAILDGFKNNTLKAVYYSITVDGKKMGCASCQN